MSVDENGFFREALRESEERHRVTLQTVMDGFFRTDLQGRILEVNETFCRMSGYSEQELLTLQIADIEAVHTAEMITANIRSFAELVPKRFESVHRRKDGSLFDVEISGQYQPIAGGQIIVFVRDITERKRAEEALQQSEAYLAEAQRLSHTGSWAFDLASSKYIYVSEECFRIFELDVHEGLPNREAISRLIHPEDWDRVNGDLEKSLREKIDVSSEFRLVLPSGTVKHIQTIRHPVLNSAGDVVRIVGTVLDITERKRAEEERHQSEERFRAIADYTYDWENWIGLDGKLLWVNPAVERITGYSVNECLTMPDFPIPIVAEPDRETVARQIREAVWGSSRNDFEFRVRHKDGHLAWVAASWQPIYDSRGVRLGHRSSIREIADRKRAEDALRRIADYLAETQRLTHTGTFVGDDTTKPLYWSDEMFRIFGFDPQQGLPTRDEPLQRIHPEDLEKFLQAFQRVIDQKVDCDVEYRIVFPDGTVKHAYGLGHPVLNANGEFVEVVGTTIDITERKRAEAEITSLKNYLSNIIDSMPSILIGMDNARTVTQWNRQAEAFTGIPAGEAIGKPVVHLLPDFAPWIMTVGNGMFEHRPLSMEKLLIAKKGERRFYDLMLYPLLTDPVGGAVLRIEDVTERARIQELMVQTEKMMSIGGLAAGMAHEINNPLGIITQAAQNIERRISPDLDANRKVSEELGLNLEGIRVYFDKRQISDALASIRTASSRAAKIVGSMLQFSRRADTTMESSSLAQIVDEALELAASDYDLKKNYDFRSIEIIKDYEDTPQVPIVSVEIEQVILNLLKNAAQAMTTNPPDRKPRITLRLHRMDRYAVLEVVDNGPGMAEDVRRRVFEPFFTTKDPGVGTGLGLSVSYMIVTQNHKGLMEVQSTPGRGAVFRVSLPIGREQT